MSNANGDFTRQAQSLLGLASELDAEIAHPNPIAEITVIGRGISGNPEIITEMIEKVKETLTVLGMSMNTNSIIFYVAQENNMTYSSTKSTKSHISNKETIAMAVKKDLVLHPNQRCRA